MKNIALHNLGCKVNSYELEVMRQKLEEKGYHIVPFDEVADVYVINTCTVTNIADRKSRQMLHRAKQKNPDAVVVAVGCYVQTGRADLEKDESIDLAVGNNKKAQLAEILEAYLAKREILAEKQDKTLGNTTVIDIDHTDEYEEMTLKRPAEHSRAYIKIQDGCNQFCTYCVIPYARGRVRSRREEDILAEIRGLAKKGYKEVVLTGIHISSYGIDFEEKRKAYVGWSRLIDLVERIQEIEGIERIRLGSLEPRIITEEAVERLSVLSKLCPHFHLSLQSGCDETLKRMNRHYTTGEYCHSVELLRKAFPHPAITTDVIVGFPGETEEEFARTREFLEKIQFYEMHIFKYSRREGTYAAHMPKQVADAVKTRRSEELFSLERKSSLEFRKYYIGKEVEVLFEENKKIGNANYLVGHTKDYVKVAVSVDDNLQKLGSGQLAVVRVEAALAEDTLLGIEFS
ncbi:MAG: tRNA (N(6)-L-threonylcarbamoyladenosine(37)-C(2))-methylthiotransferase MtaB [Candidatus Gastranaerophilales bacterium]|nr:tRNA (N(6)-L-threonylcarbamoyladenosine(37)-C(2))-methylthiotransferase MtaB [Candidatus Gastranaerophilales bacterium]